MACFLSMLRCLQNLRCQECCLLPSMLRCLCYLVWPLLLSLRRTSLRYLVWPLLLLLLLRQQSSHFQACCTHPLALLLLLLLRRKSLRYLVWPWLLLLCRQSLCYLACPVL